VNSQYPLLWLAAIPALQQYNPGQQADTHSDWMGLTIGCLVGLLAILNGALAAKKHRNALGWAILGIFVPGIFAYLVRLPNLCPRCKAPLIERWHGVCPRCSETDCPQPSAAFDPEDLHSGPGGL